jgi:hypothetical protein
VYATDANLKHFGLTDLFTRELPEAVGDAEVIVLCCPHRVYAEGWEALRAAAPMAGHVVDACNLMRADDVEESGLTYAGIGRGRKSPPAVLVMAVFAGFRAVETGIGNELDGLLRLLNERYARMPFNQVRLAEVQRLAATCPTGCSIAPPGAVVAPPWPRLSALVRAAAGQTGLEG